MQIDIFQHEDVDQTCEYVLKLILDVPYVHSNPYCNTEHHLYTRLQIDADILSTIGSLAVEKRTGTLLNQTGVASCGKILNQIGVPKAWISPRP